MNSYKLKDKPIRNLLFTMSIPSIFSMLIQSLFNIVDSYFVSKLGSEQLNAVSISFPLQMIITSFAIGIGVGINALIARKKGEGLDKEANEAANTSIVMAILIGIIFIILGLTSIPFFLKIITKNDTIISYGTSYLSIVTTFSIWVIIEITLTKILQSIGNMSIPMFCQLIGALINIILDPILIFTVNLGIRGAALATVISQFITFILVLSMFIFKKQEINISLKNFKFKRKYILSILSISLPITLINSISSLTTTFMNTILNKYFPTREESEAAINILGLYFKLQSFIFMPVYGLIQGSLPILGYSLGANNKVRYVITIKYIFFTSLIIMSIGLILFQSIPSLLLSIFNPNDLMKKIGTRAFKIISLCFIPCAFGITSSAIFQSTGSGLKLLMMTFFRQIVMIIPIALIFVSLSNANNIWFSYGIAETISSFIFFPISIKTINKQFRLRNYQFLIYKNIYF